MAEMARILLRKLLVTGYDELKRRLTRRFGSSDLATEVLHETWLRLDRVGDIATPQRPESYLYRMALNVAVDQRRADSRWIRRSDFEVLLRSDERHLDADHVISVRSEMAVLEKALAELPPRRRAIFIAALVEDLPYRDIAERLGISLRSVEREMSRALEHCCVRLEKVEVRAGGHSNFKQTGTAARKRQ